MDLIELASTLFGNGRSESESIKPDASVSIVSATGATDSADGSCGVVMDCDITPADDTDGDESILDMPTSPSVKQDDEVLVALAGDGPLKTPVVLANPGFGDRIQKQVENAEDLAAKAEKVAAATSQHFWYDDNGAHVTEATQDEWAESQSGPNSLWNSLGMLFRDGLTNLLAILTDGLVVYDGEGNANANTVAAIGKIVRLGYEAAAHIAIGSGSIDMMHGARKIFSLSASQSIDGTTVEDVSRLEVGSDEYGSGNLKIVFSHDEGSTDAHTIVTEIGADANGDTANDAYVRVVSAGGSDSEYSHIALMGANMQLNDTAGKFGHYTMGHVIDVLNGGGGAEDGTFTKGTYCNNFNRACVWRQGHMGGFSIVLQTTSNATNKAWMNVGTISIHPKAEIRCLCGNETGSFSVINITTTGQVTMLQSANGSMWSQINVVFPA